MELKMNKSKEQYNNHKARAKRKGVIFDLTFDEWLKIWTDSGHYYQKGTKRGQYVMSRYKDAGGYTIDNVYIQTVGANTKEAFTTNNKDFIKPKFGEENHFYGKKHTQESIEKIKVARTKQIWSEETNRKRSEAMKKARALAGKLWS